MASTLTVDNIVGTTTAGNVHIPGAVIQVKNTNANTRTTHSSTSYQVADDIVATITPKYTTSKILVMMNVMARTFNGGGADSSIKVGFSRDGGSTIISPIRTRAYDYGSNGIIVESSLSANFLDSPATTSSLTYQVYFAYVNGNNATVNNFSPDAHSSITLMEIAQ